MSDLSVNSVQPNMYNKNALVALLIFSSGYASETYLNMPLSHSNLIDVPHALVNSLCASSGDTPNYELTRSTAISADSVSADTELPVSGIPRMVPSSSNVMVISLKDM